MWKDIRNIRKWKESGLKKGCESVKKKGKVKMMWDKLRGKVWEKKGESKVMKG